MYGTCFTTATHSSWINYSQGPADVLWLTGAVKACPKTWRWAQIQRWVSIKKQWRTECPHVIHHGCAELMMTNQRPSAADMCRRRRAELMSNLRLKPTSALYMWMWWLVSGAEVERCRWRPTETDFTPDTNPWWGNHQPAVKSALLGKITAEVQPPALPALQNECLGITDPLFSLLSRGAQRKGKCILKPTALIFVWILLPSAESVFRSAATEQDLWRDLTGIAEQDGGGILQVCFWKTPAVSQYFQWCYHSKEFRMC